MKLPFRSGKGKGTPVKAAPARASTTKPLARLSLRSQMLLLMLAGLLLAVLPPLVVYMQTEFQLRGAGQRHAEQVAGLLAGGIRQWVEQQALTAERAVTDPELARLMEQGDEAARATQAEQLAGRVPTAVRVRL
jgi:hypothetical protein